ncbi:uncharacterized protein Dwil_GK21900 [Drosophila willistoni]|uniref:GK21900 n=1 Tax=Drosophila willistoni TaxID=7260 RepID=B4MQM1_DROWI|nr:uncharacterized protein LOC6640580 [Drosophila willistoni]EDW74410.1 uncharacterized protein Dwil_GK21900 [Drosophila willistoni]
MMEALEQQPTNSTSNSDGGGEESGTGTGAGAGTGSGGSSSSEEDELDDSKVMLDAPKAEMEHSEEKTTTTTVLAEKGKEQEEIDRAQDSDSDIKVSLANGQASLSDDEKDGREKEESVKPSLEEEKQQVQEQVIIQADVKVENEEDSSQLSSDPVKEENLVEDELPTVAVLNDEDPKDDLKEEVFNSVSPQAQVSALSSSASSSDRSSPVLAMDVDVDMDHDLPITSENWAPTETTDITESIKVESEPDTEGDKVIGETSLEKITPKSSITETATTPIKLNGAHESFKEESNEEQKQPTVIAQEAAMSPAAVSPPPPPHMFLPIRRDRSKSISSQCSSVSSASQPQLVIDHHPESEQNVRVQPLKMKKRRRSSQSSSSQIVSQPNEKQIRVNSEPEAESLTEAEPQPETSLLMQRLQGQISTLSATESATPAIASASTTSPLRLKKERFFRCARCNSVHQCWNFFLHMREVHQRYICLYCSHVYASVEKLSLHLENKHDIDQSHFATRETWVMQQQQHDRPRYLICCTCQSTFDTGSRYEDHDCAQLMQPCALCGEKGCHALGCRNTKKKPPPPRRRKKARKAQTVQDQNPLKETVSNSVPTAPQMDQALTPEGYIPAPPIYPAPEMYPYPQVSSPAPQTPPPAIPKLVVPKIMLRVPKEFQKSVDATLSSTDTEDETEEVPNNEPLPSCSPPLPQPEMPSNHLPLSSDPLPPPADEDSPTAKLSRVLAEIERTKLDIERTKADIFTKKHAKVAPEPPPVAPPDIHHQQQPEEQQRRWSLTPPASPPVITTESQPDAVRRNSLGSDCMDIDESMHQPVSMEQMQMPEHPQQAELEEQPQQNVPLDLEPMQLHNDEEYQPSSSPPPPRSPLPPAPPAPPADGIDVAGPETHTVDLQLDRPLDKISMVDLIRLCMKTVYPLCLYCNHARRIAVNGKQLVLHMIGEHRFTATVDSITAEELHAETLVAKLKSFLPLLETEYLNLASCCSVRDENGEATYVEPFNERIYECFTCRFVTSTHKELYTHNRRLHIKSNIMCTMCRTNFYSYSEILCHICPGRVTGTIYALQFRCCLCEMAPLPSAFRLMVHLRKQHQACDICLEDCHSQAKLSSHVWKHKLLHLCYRCGIAYRNKQDISKHLFWKHGTESANCKRCLQKRWRHVYHFCVPPAQFPCEHCGFIFSKAIYLEVHKRMHTGDFRYPCTEVDSCEEKFVSRKLLMKHLEAEHMEKEQLPAIEDVPQAAENESAEPVAKEDADKMDEVKSQQPEAAEMIKVERERQSSIDVKVESEMEPKMETIVKSEDQGSSKPLAKSEQKSKRRKKSKRNKESLEDLNLIAPNLSESDSSSDSDSDAPRSNHDMALPIKPPSSASVDDLDMPKVMLSPSSESDNDGETQVNQLLEKEKKKEESEQQQQEAPSDQMPKIESGLEDLVAKEQDGKDHVDAVPDIWKNLLQNQAPGHKNEQEKSTADDEADEELQRPPNKLHVVWSDHDYCKMRRTPPPPSPVKQSRSAKSGNDRRISGNSSESDSSSSSSSNSDSDSSSCSCGTNCTCSSSNSSSSSDDSDDSDSSNGQSSPQKQQRSRKKSLKQKKIDESLVSNELDGPRTQEEEINVTTVSEEQPLATPDPPPGPPSPKLPMYNESDFDTAFSDTDEEFYDAHPQKLATESLTQNRETVNPQDSSLETSNNNNNYDIVENSRPSTPSLPEEAAAFAERRERVRNKKKKRERKSSCKSGRIPPGIVAGIPTGDSNCMPTLSSTPMEPPILPMHSIVHNVPVPLTESPVSLLPMLPTTPLTHLMQPSLTRMSEGSSCSDADGQLKRSKRQRRPNKFYGYTSDDENMTTILAPPLQVGMQLIKPQPPPQLTWAKEDLPTPPKQRHRTSNNNNNNNNHHLHSNGCGTPLASSGSGSGTRKRSSLKQRNLMSSANRSAKRQKLDRDLPPIPTLKIRPGLLTSSSVAPPSDSSDSSTEDEDTEINVTTLPPCPSPSRPPPPIMSMPIPVAQPAAAAPPTLPPPPPATATAFNQPIPPALLPNPDFATLQYFKANNIRYPIRPPAGARLAREGESVYCYCRCPYDEVSEMIACDGDNCLIEWFHFECVGIMVAPQGKWFCAECRPKYSEGLYAGAKAK